MGFDKSESIALLAKALVTCQGKLRNVHKDSTNPHYKSKYANLPDVLDLIRPVLTECGLSLFQMPVECGDTACLTTVLMHESGEHISSMMALRPVKHDPQGVGSALTYARRYAAMSMLGIAGTDDDDDGQAGSAPQNAPASRPQPQEQPARPHSLPQHMPAATQYDPKMYHTCGKLIQAAVSEQQLLAAGQMVKQNDAKLHPDDLKDLQRAYRQKQTAIRNAADDHGNEHSGTDVF